MVPHLHLAALLLALSLIGGGTCTFSLFLPEKSAAEYQQLVGPPEEQYGGGRQQQYLQQQEYLQQQPDSAQQQQYLQQQPDSAQQQQYLQQQPDSAQQQQYLQQQPDSAQQHQYGTLQGGYGQEYTLQHPQHTSSLYWAGEDPQAYQQQEAEPEPEGAEADPSSGGYRYQSYQSTYRHQVRGGLPYAVFPGPPQVYQHHHQIPQHSPLPHTYQQLPGPLVVGGGVGEGVVPPPHRLAPPTSLPVYQLMTIGPEVPVLVRLPNQQTAILPVRTVYSLPSFLERIVQRVQNYYSVYNPLEQFPRYNDTFAPSSSTTEANAPAATDPTTSTSDSSLSDRVAAPGSGDSSTSTTGKVSTLKVFEVASTTTMEPSATDSTTTTAAEEAGTTTPASSEDNTIQSETTTTTTEAAK